MVMRNVFGRRALLLAVIFAVCGVVAGCDKAPANAEEEAVSRAFVEAMLQEHNYARTKPKEYAEKFIKPHFGKTNGYAESCYKTMTTMQPVGELQLDERFCRAAQWFANDLGRTGAVGHVGSDGSQFWERLKREGAGNALSESCSWGIRDARAVLVQLLIDEGVPSLGHRNNALNPKAKVIGVGQVQGGKAAYGVATVIDYGY